MRAGWALTGGKLPLVFTRSPWLGAAGGGGLRQRAQLNQPASRGAGVKCSEWGGGVTHALLQRGWPGGPWGACSYSTAASGA